MLLNERRKMFPVENPTINPDRFSRCEEQGQIENLGKSRNAIQKADVVLKEAIDHAFWKDTVLRAIDYYEIEVRVKNGVVHLDGHIVSATSQIRIMNALRTVSGILETRNNLVLDDKLILEVASSLGKLEHTYGCKFFTGASHGVISLNGNVRDEDVKLLAEKCAASNPNVRGVINNVRVTNARDSKVELELHAQPFLQPTIGENIYFTDGISGVVKRVIINPNNRRVVAMVIQGKFTNKQYDLKSSTDGNVRLPEHLIVVPMKVVRYLTKMSGFLNINSNERNQYQNFDPAFFSAPNSGWVAPYPYCSEDALFPAEYQTTDVHIVHEPLTLPFTEISEGVSFKKTTLRK